MPGFWPNSDMARTLNKKGYLLRLSPYKEKDAMALILGPEGYASFLVRGAYYELSKHRPSLIELSYSEFLLDVGRGDKLSLSESKALASPRLENDLPLLASYNLLLESSAKAMGAVDEIKMFGLLDKIASSIKEGYDPISASSIYLAKLISLLGLAPKIDGCADCNKKDEIVAFSLRHGGLLCRNDALKEGISPNSAKYIQIARYCFMCPLNDVGRVELSKAEAMEFIKHCLVFVSEESGLSLHSAKLLASL